MVLIKNNSDELFLEIIYVTNRLLTNRLLISPTVSISSELYNWNSIIKEILINNSPLSDRVTINIDLSYLNSSTTIFGYIKNINKLYGEYLKSENEDLWLTHPVIFYKDINDDIIYPLILK